MKELNITIVLLTAIIGCYLITSSNSYQGNNTEIIVFQGNHHSAFKKWLKDSLSVMESKLLNERNDGNGFENYQIKISGDSLSMEITKKFDIQINPENMAKVNPMITNIINLLKEYGELPTGNFKLKFSTLDSYYPSSARYLIYDDLFEVKDMEIEKSNTVINYTYIRGRINDKTVAEMENGKKVVVYYNFIWKGDSLTKIRQ